MGKRGTRISMENTIVSLILGLSKEASLRRVGGYDWLQHLAMSAIFDDRNDHAGAWLHSKAAAKSFVASLQLMASSEVRQWFHLPRNEVLKVVSQHLLPTIGSHAVLLENAFARFAADVGAVMAEVEPTMARLRQIGDFSLLSNVYLNAVRRMPHGVGVYFVADRAERRFTDVEVYPRNGLQAYLAASRNRGDDPIVADAVSYYATVIDHHEAGEIVLSMEELEVIEETLVSLLAGKREADPHTMEAGWIPPAATGMPQAVSARR